MSFGISLNKSFTSHKKLKRCYIISTLMNSCVYACVVRVCMYVRMRERERTSAIMCHMTDHGILITAQSQN